MLRICCLNVAILVAITGYVKGADTTVPGLLKIGKDPAATLVARNNAIDELGLLAAGGILGDQAGSVATDLAALLTRQPILHTDNGGNVVANDNLHWHVIRTLGQIGVAAQPALPAIAQLQTQDPTVIAAVAEALQTIAPAKSDTTKLVSSPAPPNPTTIVGLGLDLGSSSAAIQMAALKNLGDLKDAALPLLSQITALMSSAGDADVRREAAEATKILVEILVPSDDKGKPTTAANEEWLRIYVENLNSMLSDAKHDQQERVFAVVEIVNALKNHAKVNNVASYAKGALLTAQSDKDAIVLAIAKAVGPKP